MTKVVCLTCLGREETVTRSQGTSLSHMKWSCLRKRPCITTYLHKREPVVHRNLIIMLSSEPQIWKEFNHFKHQIIPFNQVIFSTSRTSVITGSMSASTQQILIGAFSGADTLLASRDTG